jgi:aconitate hydratase
VRAAIAESYERIHRSNLVGMGILPVQFLPGETALSLNLTGEEIFEMSGVNDLVRKFAPGRQIKVRAVSDGKTVEFNALVRIDTPQEAQYYANGGILQFVLRQLIASKPTAVHA